MTKIYIGSSNKHKIFEFNHILKVNKIQGFEFIKFPYNVENIEENGATYEENAIIKLKAYSKFNLLPLVTDDSGLEIEALNNTPGIKSARFLGEHISYRERFNYIIDKLKGLSTKERKAKFVCTLAYKDSNKQIIVRGECEGIIVDTPVGDNGFGYDPIFYIPQLKKTMAELSDDEKCLISHRAKATLNLVQKLNK